MKRIFLLNFYLLIFVFFIIQPDLCFAVSENGKTESLKPDGIILHTSICPGPGGALLGNKAEKKSVRYHFLVLKNGSIITGKPEKEILPHIGNKFMARSLSVFVEGSFEEKPRSFVRNPYAPKLPPAQEKALVSLLFALMKKYEIPLSQIERHIDNNEEIDCPGSEFPYFDILLGMAKKMIAAEGNPTLAAICKAKKIKLPLPKASIVITKSRKKLELYYGTTLLKTYQATFSDPNGDKLQKGDCKTPAGKFYICEKYPMRAWMELSFPDEFHAKKALEKNIIDKTTFRKIAEKSKSGGMPQHGTNMGYDVGIHAAGFTYGKMEPNSTAGCIGLEDPEAFELYNAVPVGSEVLISE
ncbi:MAG: L,D-transpeptidase family protein [Firmicutes bacterium]|nr:L,D-transpeptidase family protein [Bacillota bacterium]